MAGLDYNSVSHIQLFSIHPFLFSPQHYSATGVGKRIGKARGGTVKEQTMPTSLHVFKPKVRPELGAREAKGIEMVVRLNFCFWIDDF